VKTQGSHQLHYKMKKTSLENENYGLCLKHNGTIKLKLKLKLKNR
jgi:hypothetical protein